MLDNPNLFDTRATWVRYLKDVQKLSDASPGKSGMLRFAREMLKRKAKEPAVG